jgi:hypothetical protein
MGAPNSEVDYTSATTRRGDHEVYVDMWWYWEKKTFAKYHIMNLSCSHGGKHPHFIYVVGYETGYKERNGTVPTP